MSPSGFYDPETGRVSAPASYRDYAMKKKKVVEKTTMSCLFLGGQEEGKWNEVQCLTYFPHQPLTYFDVLDDETSAIPYSNSNGKEKTIQIHKYIRHKVTLPPGDYVYVYVWDVLDSITVSIIERAAKEGLFDGSRTKER